MSTTATLNPGNQLWGIYYREYAREPGDPLRTVIEAPTKLAAEDAAEALGGWGSPLSVFPADVRSQYPEALRDPAHAHAICEEYRAAAAIDRGNDATNVAECRRIVCPLFVLWSARGSPNTGYAEEGGPLALWREWADDVRGEVLASH